MSWLVNKDGERRKRFVTPEDCEPEPKVAAYKPKRELSAETETRVIRSNAPEEKPGEKQAGEMDVQVVCANKGAQEVLDRMVAKEARDRRGRGLLDGD